MTPAQPTGHPDDWDARAILALALIGDDDLTAAARYWHDAAPLRFKPLLDDAKRRPFDQGTQRFEDSIGQPFSQGAMGRVADLVIDHARRDLQATAVRMAEGKIPLDDWQRETANEVKLLFIAEDLAGVGGVAHWTAEDAAALTGTTETPGTLAFTLDRLRAFALAVFDGEARADSLQAIRNRAGMYADAGWAVYQAARGASHGRALDENGNHLYVLERNILDDRAAHCSQCPEETELGWVPIGGLIPVGQRECHINCRCYLEYTLVPGDEEG